jgi:AraC-like DNA-binding protein
MALAFHDLASEKHPQGAVYHVADRLGYSSIHSFSKAFKREFGFTPGEVAGTRTKISNAPESSIAPRFAGVPGAQDFADAFRRIRAV